MPWLGFEPRRLAAPPPQDGVSTSFTTRAIPIVVDCSKKLRYSNYEQITYATGATGLEPATSRVTVECSNQTELRPLLKSRAPLLHRTHTAPNLDRRAHSSPLTSHEHSCTPHRTIAPTGVEPVSAP